MNTPSWLPPLLVLRDYLIDLGHPDIRLGYGENFELGPRLSVVRYFSWHAQDKQLQSLAQAVDDGWAQWSLRDAVYGLMPPLLADACWERWSESDEGNSPDGIAEIMGLDYLEVPKLHRIERESPSELHVRWALHPQFQPFDILFSGGRPPQLIREAYYWMGVELERQVPGGRYRVRFPRGRARLEADEQRAQKVFGELLEVWADHVAQAMQSGGLGGSRWQIWSPTSRTWQVHYGPGIVHALPNAGVFPRDLDTPFEVPLTRSAWEVAAEKWHAVRRARDNLIEKLAISPQSVVDAFAEIQGNPTGPALLLSYMNVAMTHKEWGLLVRDGASLLSTLLDQLDSWGDEVMNLYRKRGPLYRDGRPVPELRCVTPERIRQLSQEVYGSAWLTQDDVPTGDDNVALPWPRSIFERAKLL